MKITHAVDWDRVGHDLLMQLNAINYNPDLRLMLKNITGMVTELSKLEVSARRINKDTYTKDHVEKINQAIDHLEKLILMAKLMG